MAGATPKAPRRSCGSTWPPGDPRRFPRRFAGRCARSPGPEPILRHDRQALGAAGASHRPGQHHPFARRIGNATAWPCRTTPRGGVVDRVAGTLMARGVGGRRVIARAASARWSTATACRARSWFPDARLNFRAEPASSAGRRTMPADALVFWARQGARRMSHRELHADASRRRLGARVHGCASATASPRSCRTSRRPSSRCSARPARGPGFSCARRTSASRVCRTASDRSRRAVLFTPTAMVPTASHRHPRQVAEIVDSCRPVERVVVVPYLDADIGPCQRIRCSAAARRGRRPGAVRVGRDRLRVLLSTPALHRVLVGTTGVPKCIVHGAGGVPAPAPEGAPSARRRGSLATGCSTSPPAAG